MSGEPAARSHFDVHLGDGTLVHVKEPCVRRDVLHRVFMQVTPEDPKRLPGENLPRGDLPRWNRRYGREEFYTSLERSGVLFEGKCMAVLPLPDYPASSIRTGHRKERGRVLWAVEIPAR